MSERRPVGDTADKVPASAQALMLAGGIVHVAYGVGSLFTPQKMVDAQFAPNTHDLPDPRLLLRAFGGHLLISGCLTLAAIRSPRRARPTTMLCLLINASDVSSAVLELRARGQSDESTVGGIALSGCGVLAFATALGILTRRSAAAYCCTHSPLGGQSDGF